MIDAAQAILLFVIFILTILLVVLGIQVYFILRELRRTVQKTNKVLDDAGTITESVTGPVSAISTLATGITTGSILSKIIKNRRKIFDIFTKSDKKGDNGE